MAVCRRQPIEFAPLISIEKKTFCHAEVVVAYFFRNFVTQKLFITMQAALPMRPGGDQHPKRNYTYIVIDYNK